MELIEAVHVALRELRVGESIDVDLGVGNDSQWIVRQLNETLSFLMGERFGSSLSFF